MPTLRLDIAYEGTGFSGWARQPGLRTVQGELEAALETILRHPAALTVAGRTDAGVHAWAQVASLEVEAEPPSDLARRLNAVSPPDLAVNAVTIAANGFDARRDARSRTYCYRIHTAPQQSPFERGRTLWWPYPLDRPALDACAAALPGTHDFTAFTPSQTEHVRFERNILRAEWSEETAGILCFWIEADAFMRNMVRVLVGTMLEAATARRSVESFTTLLEGARREQAGETAAAAGLYLAFVSY